MVEIDTNKLVMISEFLSPIYLPKNPDRTDPNKGRKTNAYSILSFQGAYIFNANSSWISVVYYYYSKSNIVPIQNIEDYNWNHLRIW